MNERETLLARAYARWRLPLLRMLGKRLRNHEDAEDAAQEVFARYAAAGKALPAAEQEPYLHQAAIHLLHDAWHKSRRRGRAEMVSYEEQADTLAQLPAGDAFDPVQGALHRQRLRRLETAMAELPERQRQAFVLYGIDGLSQTEVAERMGISRRMVYTHIQRAFAYCELRVRFGSAEEMELMRGLHGSPRETGPAGDAS